MDGRQGPARRRGTGDALAAGVRRAGAIVVAAGALALAVLLYGPRDEAAEKREWPRVVATVTTVPTACPDDQKPFHVTIRNIASRNVESATFVLHEDPLPAGTLPSDMPRVSLEAPLPRGQAVSGCHALNRYRLIARGVEPRSVHFMAMPESVVFE